MDPQHLTRPDDEGSVRTVGTGTAGGSSATASPEGSEVPAPVAASERAGRSGRTPALVRRRRRRGAAVVLAPDELSDAWPLPVAPTDRLVVDEAWPLLDVDAGRRPAADVATGPRHRRPGTRMRRPALCLATALIGAAGLALTVTGERSVAAEAGVPVSVAEELGMVQAEQPVLSEDEATARLQQLVASRAEREDAQAAAAQVQADADRAAIEAAAAAQAAADAAAAAAAAEAARPEAVLPVQGARLSSGFGDRWGTLHAGVDFAGPIGTPEYAAMDGVVVRAGAASGFGLAVYVQHRNGDVTVYGHMQEILVEEGQTVRAGETIALLGNRGQSTGPHLHFEVHVGGIEGERVDPLPWLRAHGVGV